MADDSRILMIPDRHPFADRFPQSETAGIEDQRRRSPRGADPGLGGCPSRSRTAPAGGWARYAVRRSRRRTRRVVEGDQPCVALGLRGLPGDSSLAELLAEHRGVPLPDMGAKALADKIWAWEQEEFPLKGPRRRKSTKPTLPPLTIGEILAWADAHHAATGSWPTSDSGKVIDAPRENWANLDSLPPGTTRVARWPRLSPPARRAPRCARPSADRAIDHWRDLDLGRRPSCGHRSVAVRRLGPGARRTYDLTWVRSRRR